MPPHMNEVALEMAWVLSAAIVPLSVRLARLAKLSREVQLVASDVTQLPHFAGVCKHKLSDAGRPRMHRIIWYLDLL